MFREARRFEARQGDKLPRVAPTYPAVFRRAERKLRPDEAAPEGRVTIFEGAWMQKFVSRFALFCADRAFARLYGI